MTRRQWPRRLEIAFLSFLALLIAYCDRVNLSVAAPRIMQEYHWDTAQMGWALSGFFVGYVLLMVPTGILADRYGPRRVFAWSMAWWSVFTALTPIPRSLAGLSTIRVLMGTGESGTFPAINSILVSWFPRQEYSRVAGFCWSGGYAGPIIGFPLASAILAWLGWRAVFFAFACLGLIWLPFWLWRAADNPESARGIRASELAYIQASRPELRRAAAVPWKRLLGLPALWAVFTLHFSSNWFAYVMLSWLPTYLLVERRFSLGSMAIGTALPYVSALVGTNLFGFFIDRFTEGRDRSRVRKMFLLPYLLAAGSLLLLPGASSAAATVLLLCAAMGLLTAATPIYASNTLDLAPRYAGTVVGMQNSVANLAGVLAPVVIGYVVKVSGWNTAFWLTAAINGLGALAFWVFGKAERLVD
ncbi:MAG: MFS transporter [Acidobacteria bacterium]|nr:MFS transporter [Acidobacteriota bacterium]